MEKLILKEIQVLANDNLRAMFAFSHLSEIFSKDEFLYDFARIHAKNAENARRNLQTIINYLHLRKEKLLLEESLPRLPRIDIDYAKMLSYKIKATIERLKHLAILESEKELAYLVGLEKHDILLFEEKFQKSNARIHSSKLGHQKFRNKGTIKHLSLPIMYQDLEENQDQEKNEPTKEYDSLKSGVDQNEDSGIGLSINANDVSVQSQNITSANVEEEDEVKANLEKKSSDHLAQTQTKVSENVDPPVQDRNSSESDRSVLREAEIPGDFDIVKEEIESETIPKVDGSTNESSKEYSPIPEKTNEEDISNDGQFRSPKKLDYNASFSSKSSDTDQSFYSCTSENFEDSELLDMISSKSNKSLSDDQSIDVVDNIRLKLDKSFHVYVTEGSENGGIVINIT